MSLLINALSQQLCLLVSRFKSAAHLPLRLNQLVHDFLAAHHVFLARQLKPSAIERVLLPFDVVDGCFRQSLAVGESLRVAIYLVNSAQRNQQRGKQQQCRQPKPKQKQSLKMGLGD